MRRPSLDHRFPIQLSGQPGKILTKDAARALRTLHGFGERGTGELALLTGGMLKWLVKLKLAEKIAPDEFGDRYRVLDRGVDVLRGLGWAP